MIQSIAIACIILAIALPWFGTGLAITAMVCAVAAGVLGIVLLVERAFVPGIVILVVAFVSGFVSILGYGLAYGKEIGMFDQIQIQAGYIQKIEAARSAGNITEVKRLEQEQKNALEQYKRELEQKQGSKNND